MSLASVLTFELRKQRQAIEIAVLGSQVLKKQFGVTKMVLFGSMLDVSEIYDDSDIDLAVWGLSNRDLLKAGCILDDIVYKLGYDFPAVDLVDVRRSQRLPVVVRRRSARSRCAKPHILEAIESSGVEV